MTDSTSQTTQNSQPDPTQLPYPSTGRRGVFTDPATYAFTVMLLLMVYALVIGWTQQQVGYVVVALIGTACLRVLLDRYLDAKTVARHYEWAYRTRFLLADGDLNENSPETAEE